MITLLLIFMAVNLYPRMLILAATGRSINMLQTMLDAPTLTLKIFPPAPITLVAAT